MIRNARPSFDRYVRPTGVCVTIRARDDLDPNSDTVGVQNLGKSVTAIPENVGLCQVVEVGPDVTNVRPGDICFIDFFDVQQAFLVAGEEVYSTLAMALRMRLHIQTEDVLFPNGEPHRHQKTGQPLQRVIDCRIEPLPGFVLTKHAPDRMTVVVTGTDRHILPRSLTTSGLVGGRNSDGDPCTHVVYEEVVEVGEGDIQCEREDGYTERKLKARIQRLEAELSLAGVEVPQPPASDLSAGDLVVYCAEFAIKFRAMGEEYRCVPYRNVLAVVDDAAVLAAFNATNPPKPLVQIIGGGSKLLYGT